MRSRWPVWLNNKKIDAIYDDARIEKSIKRKEVQNYLMKFDTPDLFRRDSNIYINNLVYNNFDMTEFNKNDLLVGRNYSGKSTRVDAILYALLGHRYFLKYMMDGTKKKIKSSRVEIEYNGNPITLYRERPSDKLTFIEGEYQEGLMGVQGDRAESMLLDLILNSEVYKTYEQDFPLVNFLNAFTIFQDDKLNRRFLHRERLKAHLDIIFNLNISSIITKINNELIECKKNITLFQENQIQYNELEESVQNLSNNLVELEHEESEFIVLINNNIKSNNQLSLLNDEVIEMDNRIRDINDIISRLKDEKEYTWKSRLNIVRRKISEENELSSNVLRTFHLKNCPICKQELNQMDEKKCALCKSPIHKQIVKDESVVSELLKNERFLSEKIETIKTNIRKMRTEKELLKNNKIKLSTEIENITEPFDKSIKQMEVDLTEIKFKIIDTKSEIKYYQNEIEKVELNDINLFKRKKIFLEFVINLLEDYVISERKTILNELRETTGELVKNTNIFSDFHISDDYQITFDDIDLQNENIGGAYRIALLFFHLSIFITANNRNYPIKFIIVDSLTKDFDKDKFAKSQALLKLFRYCKDMNLQFILTTTDEVDYNYNELEHIHAIPIDSKRATQQELTDFDKNIKGD